MPGLRSLKRVLIANRGEIARRIIRTCARLGIETVTVYTSADEHAPHTRESTLSECIGAPESYLDGDKIISVALRTGADAIHPGYGFLSENASFAAAVAQAGICWIGPSSATIERLGSKTAAKELAHLASIPTSPTLILQPGDDRGGAADIVDFGRRVGFPLILKAAAGGGGRGMRFIDSSTDIEGELASARREALRAFGSDEIFVEKCITRARHIEVQIAADSTGEVVPLGTRDCSLQRNNQKIIEEAPAIHLAPGVEAQLYGAAAALAKAANYSNLGTVEFLYTADGSFYFLEVNTRLQVEHPVTELVSGLDLVELQLRLAAGESLLQCGVREPPPPCGHAIEARWCAEDFTDRFVSATGVVFDLFVPHAATPGVTIRFDHGVEPCCLVSHHYDSLIGKVIAHSHDRTEAIRALDTTLSGARLSGVKNNRGLLLHLLRTDSFRNLRHTVDTTRSLLPPPEAYASGVESAHCIGAALRCLSSSSRWAEESPWARVQAPDSLLSIPWTTTSDGEIVTSTSVKLAHGVSVTEAARRVTRTVTINTPLSRDGLLTNAGVTLDDSDLGTVTTYRDGDTLWVHTSEGTYVLDQVGIGRSSLLPGSTTANEVRSSIPGKVSTVLVSVGDVVEEGAVLVVLDSMKMEHPIRSPMRGRITSLPSPQGSLVTSGSQLATIEPE